MTSLYSLPSLLGVRKRQGLKSSPPCLAARGAGVVEEMYGGVANSTGMTLLQIQRLRKPSYVPDVKNPSWAGTAVPCPSGQLSFTSSHFNTHGHLLLVILVA